MNSTVVSDPGQCDRGQLDALIRVGPLGDAPLVSKLVAVRFLEPVEWAGVTTVGGSNDGHSLFLASRATGALRL